MIFHFTTIKKNFGGDAAKQSGIARRRAMFAVVARLSSEPMCIVKLLLTNIHTYLCVICVMKIYIISMIFLVSSCVSHAVPHYCHEKYGYKDNNCKKCEEFMPAELGE